MMADKEYEICKEACKNEGCYLPEDFAFHKEVANTPMYIRVYFLLKGRKELIKKLVHKFEEIKDE